MHINEEMLFNVHYISVLYLVEKGKTPLNSCLVTKASLLFPETN